MKSRGYTLLELLVIVAIAAPITITVVASLGYAQTHRSRAARSQAALMATQEALDRTRALWTTGQPTAPLNQATTRPIQLHFGGEAILEEVVRNHPSGMLEIQVSTLTQHSAGGSTVTLTALAFPQEGKP